MTSPTRLFNWGIVGAGVIARQFAGDLASVPGARVARVHTRSGKLPDGFASLVPGASVDASLDALLADPGVDAVYIATPNAAHAEQALAAIAVGKPVLVEKPLATTSADARRIASAAQAANVFAMEAMWTRFLPAIEAARDIIGSGRIGDVQRVQAELAYRRDEAADSRFFDPAGGGASLDLGVYPLSLAMRLFGRPDHVTGQWRAARSGVDMAASYQLRFGSMTADLSCGFDRDGDNAFTVFGSKGALRIHPPFLKAQRLTVFDGFAARLPLIGADASGPLARIAGKLPLPGRQTRNYDFSGGGLQFEAAAVMKAVRAGERSSKIAPLADSISVLETIEQVLRQPPG